MKVKIKDLTEKQKDDICKGVDWRDCCTPACHLYDATTWLCAVEDQDVPVSSEFEEKEIEVDL